MISCVDFIKRSLMVCDNNLVNFFISSIRGYGLKVAWALLVNKTLKPQNSHTDDGK